MVCPVTYCPAGLAKNTAIPPMSSASPMRRKGAWLLYLALSTGSSCSALAKSVLIKPGAMQFTRMLSGPHSTAKVEELIAELKNDYTVVIVTHNMQQAARCSDYTAYMYLGDLVEFGETEQMFFKPQRKETEDYITGRFG
eukprot:gene25354-31804_t